MDISETLLQELLGLLGKELCRDLGQSRLTGDLIRNTGLVSFLNFGKTQTLLQVADSLAHEVTRNKSFFLLYNFQDWPQPRRPA